MLYPVQLTMINKTVYRKYTAQKYTLKTHQINICTDMDWVMCEE